MTDTRYKEAVEQFASKTTELARLFRERGDVEEAQVRVRAEAWQNADPLDNVTTRRENASMAASMYEASILKLRGEIEALQAELHYLEIFITYARDEWSWKTVSNAMETV